MMKNKSNQSIHSNRTHDDIPVSYARPNKTTIKALHEKGLGRYHDINKMVGDLSK